MRLVDAEALREGLQNLAYDDWNQGISISVADAFRDCADMINDAPTVDAVPVVHGRWIYNIDDLFPAESTQECDQCHEKQPLTCDDNYCPNCGAKMDGDRNG